MLLHSEYCASQFENIECSFAFIACGSYHRMLSCEYFFYCGPLADIAIMYMKLQATLCSVLLRPSKTAKSDINTIPSMCLLNSKFCSPGIGRQEWITCNRLDRNKQFNSYLKHYRFYRMLRLGIYFYNLVLVYYIISRYQFFHINVFSGFCGKAVSHRFFFILKLP